MKKQCLFKRMLVLLLCAALVLPCLPLNAFAAALGNFDTGSDFSGVKLSLIGDSISTYYGVSNSSTYNPLYLSTSEATFGTYYGNTSHGDYAEFSSVKRADTWWQQTVDTLGMDLLVNNAWSGSFTLVDTGQSNTTEYPAAGYKTRCVNLHNGTTKPDIICVYLGTNDIAYYSTQNVGTKADIDTASERSALYTSVNNYSTPSSAIQAYYIMISRMLATYPDAEVYCLLPTICQNTMGSGRKNALTNFNAGVRYIVDHYAGNGKSIYLVDLPEYSGLVDQEVVRNYYYCNNVHPSCEGMDFITSCLVSEILEHSKKGKQTSEICDVTYSFDRTFSKTGLPRKTVVGKPFSLDILPYVNSGEIQLTVTMKDANGADVTIPGGGVSGDSVYIPAVTGDITVSATLVKEDSFYWKAVADDFAAIPGDGYTYNKTTLLSGTYEFKDDTGVMSTVQYSLNKPVLLQHDMPWVLEWKSGGNTYAGGIMLFNKEADSSTDGNMYIHITQSNVFFGYRDSVGYNNSGIAWTTIAEKLGSTAGADIRNEMLEFKVVNVPDGTNNKLWLYVNGVQIGTMDSSKAIGSDASHASVGDINLSGKDFEFNYLGSASHSWQNCNISYIRAYETGTLETVTSFDDYRWEPSGGELVSLENETFTENVATMVTGSISGTTFTGATFELDEDVVLKHDKSWVVEWASSGSWSGDRNGSFLMSTILDYKANSAHYIFRQGGSSLIGIGEWTNGIHNNYGLSLADYGIDGTAYHKYAMKNEPVLQNGAWVSNMVYLYVDDVKLGAMNQYFPSGTADGTTSDWLNGRDLVFGAIGNASFTLGGCDLDYLQITTGCAHSFGSWKTTTAAGCTTEGVQTRSCTICGEEQTQALAATGHSYSSITYETNCQTYAHTCYTCVNCGDSYNTYPEEAMSPWQENKPDVDESMIETATQYRYMDYETTTSYETSLEGYEQVSSEWIKYDTGTVNYVNSWPTGFSTSNSLYNKYDNKAQKVTASVSATTKTEINSDQIVGYLYYHWCYSGYPYTVNIQQGSYNRFHAFYSTMNPDDADSYDSSDGSYRIDSATACSDSVWYFVVPVYGQSYTTYKNLYTYGRWGTPSEWSTTPVEADDARKVETRTVYRYVTGELGEHNYVNNVCSVCGEAKPVFDYYLFGYINGANYGCEEDYQNLGSYKFVDGKLTAKFQQDSYVAVKTGDNVSWYMTEGWQGNGTTSVILYNTQKATNPDKLFVPAGVELEFTLADNGDDTLTLSYEIKQCLHTYEGVQTKAPSCTSAGVMTYTCSQCGHSYTEIISATGHSYKETLTKPTCTEGGYTTYTCSVCGSSYIGSQTAALGHSYSTTIVPPTCTEGGYTSHTCAACGDSYTDNETPADGHSYVDGFCGVCGAADPNASATGSYVLVTDPEQITAGGRFVIVANGLAMGTTLTSGKLDPVAVTIEGNTVVGSNLPVWTVEGVSGGINLILDGQYLAYNSSTNFKMDTSGYTWTVTEGENGYILNSADTNRGIYYYSTAAKFGAYATSNANASNYVSSLQLYKYQEDTPDYYLVGWINGADYGCEGDADNMGQYKFTNGQLTATFDQDSYVFLKTEGNADWYMTQSYCSETSGTFYSTTTGATEKMIVPGGVEVTFTLTDNGDGSLTLSYVTAAVEPSVVPTLKPSFPTLTFEDVITMNVYFTVSDMSDVVEMGLITYSSEPAEFSIDNAEKVIPGYRYSDSYQMYAVSTEGIAAKDMSDEIYFAIYTELADGTYAYSRMVSYSPTNYAYTLLGSADESVKQLMVALLNYGAEAQTFFNYRTDALMNANLTAEQQATIETYRADMMDAVSSVSAAKAANFTRTASGFTSRYPSISFEGAFKINYYCVPSATVQGNVTLYYWNQADFDAADVLTVDNATAAIVMTNASGSYETAVTGIAAKDLDKGVYVAFVYTDGTNTYCSGILGYSIGAYCVSNAASTAAIAPFAKATAVYGYYAKQTFYKAA